MGFIKPIFLAASFIFVCWTLLTIYHLSSRSPINKVVTSHLLRRLNKLEKELYYQTKLHEDVLRALKQEQRIALREILGVGAADKLPNQEDKDSAQVEQRFPIIVSQDCAHGKTAAVIEKYKTSGGVIHLKQPNQTAPVLPVKARKFAGYYKIARHYKLASTKRSSRVLNGVLIERDHSSVIILEDDLDISPDLFEYFTAARSILIRDPSLWCVSAWNDNGKPELVDQSAHDLLYRTDFFPGLGWMLLKSTWLELSAKWPTTFWDDWMRHPDQRKERSCIRPEIPRTSTFGRKGVSLGQYFDKHLKFIKRSDAFVAFTKKDTSGLVKSLYDKTWNTTVYSAREVGLQQVLDNAFPRETVRIIYHSKADFKICAKRLGIMDDFKSGVPRMAYRGVVAIFRNQRRVFLAPPENWRKYDLTWT